MKIAIIDDDIIFCSELEKILYSILKKEIVSIDIFYDGKDFIDNWKSQNPYDIVFLDIEMKIYDGYTTGELIRKNDPYENIYIVYISLTLTIICVKIMKQHLLVMTKNNAMTLQEKGENYGFH